MLKRISIILLAVILGMLTIPFPAHAATLAYPDVAFQLTQVEVYRNTIELDDQLYLISFNIEYTANNTPSDPIDDTFIFRLVSDNGTILSTTTAYGCFNDGYDRGIASIYFSADDAPTWGASANYTMYFEGNPILSWAGGVPPNVNTNSFSLWYDGGTITDTRDRLTTRLRYIAQQLETDWGGTTDLIEDTSVGKVLTTEGEDYFENSILDLRSMCPDLFYQTMKAAVFADDILVLDFHAGGADDVAQVYGVNWFAQTFEASDAYDITGVQIPVYRTGTPGTVTVSLRATAAGVPTGADLTSGTYDGDTVTTDTGAEWIAIAFDSDYSLVSGTTYAIVVRATAGDANNRLNWQVDTDGGYDDGQEATSVNSGVAWNGVAANDMLFEVLVRGGATYSLGHRYELKLLGTQFDVSQIASNWGLSTMWVSTAIWLAMGIALMVAVAMSSNAWDCWWIILAMMAAYGWRAGFADTYLLVGVLAMSSVGIVYALLFKKVY